MTQGGPCAQEVRRERQVAQLVIHMASVLPPSSLPDPSTPLILILSTVSSSSQTPLHWLPGGSDPHLVFHDHYLLLLGLQRTSAQYLALLAFNKSFHYPFPGTTVVLNLLCVIMRLMI